MLDILRRFKFTYSLYNYFHKKELIHNETLFKKWGIHKKYFSPVSSKDFNGLHPEIKQEDTLHDFTSYKLFTQLDEQSKNSLLHFHENGYAKINHYLGEEEVDAVNGEIEKLVSSQKLKFKIGRKLMFAIHHSELIKNIGNDENLKSLLGILLGGEAILFQSINFLMGSEQDSHSDSIHMTTFPLGGLLGVWVALEDITIDNGPLHYYPKSHKLPYYLNADYDNEGTTFLLGDKSYSAYEKMIEDKIHSQNIKKEILLAEKGDLFIWHANLIHGGEPHKNKDITRRSMVFHYFKKGSVCYHEITQRPALIKFLE